MSKSFSLGTLWAFMLTFASVVGTYVSMQNDVQVLKNDIKTLKDNYIAKDLVDQMFITRDNKIVEVKEDVKENQKLLREILQKIHSHPSE